MAAEFIGMIQEAIKTFDQQGNAGGSCIFFADQQKECGGSAEMAAKDVEVAEMEAEEDAAKGGCRGDNQWQLRPLGYRRLLGLFVITLLVSDTHVTHPAYSVFPLRFLWTSLKTWRMLMMKTWLILMMSPNQELLLPESWDLKGREPTKNLDVVSRGAVNRRPAGPVFFLRPNRFRPLLTYLKTIYLSMTHPTLL
jgi:hypothetical protein